MNHIRMAVHNFVFLTGSTGLIGGHLLIHLHQSGYKVRALIRPSSSFEELRLICDYYKQSFEELYESVEWVYGDTRDYVGLCDLLVGVKQVFHCAGVVSFNSKNTKDILQTNIQGTSNMVDAALKCFVEQFCFISSISALGNEKSDDFINEDTRRKNDEIYSVYSESKFRAELEVWRGNSEGLNTVILNPGVILGPGNPRKGSLLLFQTGRKGVPFYTEATTGYVDVRDVCLAGIELMRKGIFGERFILVSENIGNKDLFSMIASEFNAKPPRYHVGRLLLQTSACLSEFFGKLTGSTPQLTRETVRTALNSQKYSSQKIKKVLNFQFTPCYKTIQDTCTFIKEKAL